MKFFIDTANLEQIREMQALGIIDGVTTNPTLLSREGREPKEQLKKICEIVEGPISAEVIGLKTEKMVEEARELSNLAPNIVIKIPMTKEGIKASFDKLYSKDFQESLKDIKNPYKGGNVSGRIVKRLKEE